MIFQQTTNSSTSKRGWTQQVPYLQTQEDNLILQMMADCPQDHFKWIQVSKTLEIKTGRFRSGKQCRERWQHQLNPSINRNQWTEAEQLTLFQMQNKMGNKWAQISAFLPGRTDNAVKNYFYSSVRRVLTKINLYLGKQKSRRQFKIIRLFEADYLSKLMAVVDGHFDKRMRLSGPETVQLAKNILASIINLVTKQNQIDLEESNQAIDNLILNMQDFRKSCKKRKQAMLCDEYQRYPQCLSVEEESAQGKTFSSDGSFGSQKEKKSIKRQRSVSVEKNVKQQMEIQCATQGSGLFLTTRNSTKSIEQNFELPQDIKFGSMESFAEPRILKGMSEFNQQNKQESFMDFFNEEQLFKKDRMDDEICDLQNVFDVFAMPFGGQNEDILGESQGYGSTQIVTNCKMLEASIALDQLLLRSRQISRPGNNN